MTRKLNEDSTLADRYLRFGAFELDLRERKLTKMGSRIRLQEQPLRVLVLLLSRPGELVTREEIRQKIWTQGVFLEFEDSLNTAVGKLRAALNDSASDPKFLETIPRQGYRWIARVYRFPEQPKTVLQNTGPVRRYRPLWVLSAIILTGLGTFSAWYLRKARSPVAAEDMIVLADFANRTGDPVFDGALKTALNLSLRQSPYLKVLPDSDIARTLRQMMLPADTKLTPDQTRELCQRARSKAYLAGSISSLGTKYVLELKAVNCANGNTITQNQVVAPSKEKTIDAVGEMASRVRGELGESLASLQEFDVPLANATTSSLEALQMLSVGLNVFTEKGPGASLTYFQRVIALDPNFALGYRSMGLSYSGLGETDRASEYYNKAFHLREHVTEWERLAITADYYLNVTGELDKAAETYQQWITKYPRNDGAYSTLGIVYALQGQYQSASEVTRQAIHLAPSYGSYVNLAYYELAMQRFDQAQMVTAEAQMHRMDGAQFHSLLYALAFLGKHPAGMSEQRQWFRGKSDEPFGLALESDTEGFIGHLGQARKFTSHAVDLAIRSENQESGAIWLANLAVEEAAVGEFVQAHRTADKALELAPESPGVQAETALAFAMSELTHRAISLVESIRQHRPLDTQMHSLWLPAIQLQVALNRRITTHDIDSGPAREPTEFGTILFAGNMSCLYPTYLRGQAYLAAEQAAAAEIEFRKIVDHSGIVWSCWTGALARLGVARARALRARMSEARDTAAHAGALAAYREFLELWKDADNEIPILKQAKLEYAQLQ